MDDINSFYRKREKLKYVLNEIKSLCHSSSDIKELIILYNKYCKLEKTLKQLKPIYFKKKMQECNHLFIKCSYKHFDSGDDKYILYIDHYCLKCGCSTKKLDEYYLKDNNVTNLATFYVSHNDQIEIIESANNYQVIDFNDKDLYELVIKWEQLKRAFKNKSFSELLSLFVKMNKFEEGNKKGNKIYEFKYLNN